MTQPFVDELDQRADRILHDPATYFADMRLQAREEVKVEMARESH